MEQLLCHLTTISLTDSEDILEWRVDGILRNTFCSSIIYGKIREPLPLVRWSSIVWFKRGIPKHKTLTWMVVLDRCPTRDRLLSWGLQTDHICLLCNQASESRDHLFFHCSYSCFIWSNLSSKLEIVSSSFSWLDVMDSLLSLSGNNHRKYLSLLAWQATIYEVWGERNSRLHRNFFTGNDILLRRIDRTIRNRISSFRAQNNRAASECLQLWLSLRWSPRDPKFAGSFVSNRSKHWWKTNFGRWWANIFMDSNWVCISNGFCYSAPLIFVYWV